MNMARTYKVGPDVDLDTEVVRDSRGRRITEKHATGIAEQTLERIGRGRPSLTGAKLHSPWSLSEHQLSFELRRKRVQFAKVRRSLSSLARHSSGCLLDKSPDKRATLSGRPFKIF